MSDSDSLQCYPNIMSAYCQQTSICTMDVFDIDWHNYRLLNYMTARDHSENVFVHFPNDILDISSRWKVFQ